MSLKIIYRIIYFNSITYFKTHIITSFINHSNTYQHNGSYFKISTLKPLLFNSMPMEAAVTPLPSDDTTPPATKINFAITFSSCNSCCKAEQSKKAKNKIPYLRCPNTGRLSFSRYIFVVRMMHGIRYSVTFIIPENVCL